MSKRGEQAMNMTRRWGWITGAVFSLCVTVCAQTPSATTLRWETIRMRDPCILADAASKTYYLVGSAGRSVRAYTSTDLATWQGPQTIFTPSQDIWGDSYTNDGGHGMLFTAFDGRLIMVLHAPNGREARPHRDVPLPRGRVARIVPEFCARTTAQNGATPYAQRNKKFLTRGVFCLFNCCTNGARNAGL
jgi:hypothetical protein